MIYAIPCHSVLLLFVRHFGCGRRRTRSRVAWLKSCARSFQQFDIFFLFGNTYGQHNILKNNYWHLWKIIIRVVAVIAISWTVLSSRIRFSDLHYFFVTQCLQKLTIHPPDLMIISTCKRSLCQLSVWKLLKLKSFYLWSVFSTVLNVSVNSEFSALLFENAAQFTKCSFICWFS